MRGSLLLALASECGMRKKNPSMEVFFSFFPRQKNFPLYFDLEDNEREKSMKIDFFSLFFFLFFIFSPGAKYFGYVYANRIEIVFFDVTEC